MAYCYKQHRGLYIGTNPPLLGFMSFGGGKYEKGKQKEKMEKKRKEEERKRKRKEKGRKGKEKEKSG
jgi:hypothetical protein